jgi:hypothetical protein
MTIRDAIGWIGFGLHPGNTALATVDAFNRRDWDRMSELLCEDFYYLDGELNRIDTPVRFMASLRSLLDDAPDLALSVDTIEEAGHMVFMRGRTTSRDFRFRSRSMWRARIRGGRMASLENFRVVNSIRLAKYAREAA